MLGDRAGKFDEDDSGSAGEEGQSRAYNSAAIGGGPGSMASSNVGLTLPSSHGSHMGGNGNAGGSNNKMASDATVTPGFGGENGSHLDSSATQTFSFYKDIQARFAAARKGILSKKCKKNLKAIMDGRGSSGGNKFSIKTTTFSSTNFTSSLLRDSETIKFTVPSDDISPSLALLPNYKDVRFFFFPGDAEDLMQSSLSSAGFDSEVQHEMEDDENE